MKNEDRRGAPRLCKALGQIRGVGVQPHAHRAALGHCLIQTVYLQHFHHSPFLFPWFHGRIHI